MTVNDENKQNIVNVNHYRRNEPLHMDIFKSITPSKDANMQLLPQRSPYLDPRSNENYELIDVTLKNKLSEKELDILELRRDYFNDISKLRSSLTKKEMELVEQISENKQLKIKLLKAEEVKRVNKKIKLQLDELVKQNILLKRASNEARLNLKQNKNDVLSKDVQIETVNKEKYDVESRYKESLRKMRMMDEQRIRDSDTKIEKKNRQIKELTDDITRLKINEITYKKQAELYKGKASDDKSKLA